MKLVDESVVFCQELNERQRAEHAVRRYEQLKGVVSEMEVRNSELEQRFSEVSLSLGILVQ